MDADYPDLLNSAYNHFFFHYNSTPLLVINTNDIDFVNRKEDLDELVEQIINVKPGTTFYQPMGAKIKISLKTAKEKVRER